MNYTFDTRYATAILAIVLGTIAGVLTAAVQAGGPLEGAFWVAPVVLGITALATLIKTGPAE